MIREIDARGFFTSLSFQFALKGEINGRCN